MILLSTQIQRELKSVIVIIPWKFFLVTMSDRTCYPNTRNCPTLTKPNTSTTSMQKTDSLSWTNLLSHLLNDSIWVDITNFSWHTWTAANGNDIYLAYERQQFSFDAALPRKFTRLWYSSVNSSYASFLSIRLTSYNQSAYYSKPCT